jgi:hypothetical protein
VMSDEEAAAHGSAAICIGGNPGIDGRALDEGATTGAVDICRLGANPTR